MLDRFRRAMNYWMFAVSHPGYVLEIAQRDLHRVRISFYMVLVFSLMYSITSAILWRTGRVPLISPWAPFPEGYYYLYQALWSLPWFLFTWLVIAGFIYLLTSLSGKEAFFEDALFISSLSLVIPFLMFWWIPETFLLPNMGSGTFIRWPELFEMERKFFFPQVWQLFLVAFSMRKVNNTNRVFCLLGGTAAVLATLAMWILIMR
jgi:hypothetical protein